MCFSELGGCLTLDGFECRIESRFRFKSTFHSNCFEGKVMIFLNDLARRFDSKPIDVLVEAALMIIIQHL